MDGPQLYFKRLSKSTNGRSPVYLNCRLARQSDFDSVACTPRRVSDLPYLASICPSVDLCPNQRQPLDPTEAREAPFDCRSERYLLVKTRFTDNDNLSPRPLQQPQVRCHRNFLQGHVSWYHRECRCGEESVPLRVTAVQYKQGLRLLQCPSLS